MVCPNCGSSLTGNTEKSWHIAECGSKIFFILGGGHRIIQSTMCFKLTELQKRVEMLELFAFDIKEGYHSSIYKSEFIDIVEHALKTLAKKEKEQKL